MPETDHERLWQHLLANGAGYVSADPFLSGPRVPPRLGG